jgi:Xaa-Pro aminopeptidase
VIGMELRIRQALPPFAERRGRALEAARARGLDVLVAADPANVGWLTGLVVDCQTGPSPFAPAPALLALAPDLPPRLVVAADVALEDVDPAVEIVPYRAYGLEAIDPQAEFRRALQAVPSAPTYAVESLFVPLAFKERIDGQATVDVSKDLSDLRLVKDPVELARLTDALAVADLGHRAARALAQPGITELELFGMVRARMESEVGERLAIWADCLSGPRVAQAEGGPTRRVLEAGDVVITDLLPRLRGYWGDTASTCVVGGPTRSQKRVFQVVSDALQRGLEAVGPGARAGEVDRAVREALTAKGFSCPHHTGHGIGTTYHEEPRLIPGSSRRLREGMVLTIEPGAYTHSVGCRLEVAVLVTADGCRPLSELGEP